MYRRSAPQLQRSLSKIFCKQPQCHLSLIRTAIIPLRSCSSSVHTSVLRNMNNTNISKKNIDALNIISRRNYSESSTTSTDGSDIPEEILNLTINEYNNESDKYLDNLFDQLEELSELFPKEIPDVELNHGVMTLTIAPLGSYVINKQPPNKQIWLASPVSGPNRFDFYQNEWISLRNKQKLSEILTKELKQALPDEDINL